MVVEGVLAETGYHAYLSALERTHLVPGQCQGVRLLKQDESRHIAYGIYLISRCLAAYPEL
jgi:ribonucleoside-diphosphate reductase beta chain